MIIDRNCSFMNSGDRRYERLLLVMAEFATIACSNVQLYHLQTSAFQSWFFCWCVGKVWNHFIFTSNNHRKLSPLTAWPHKPTSESTSWFSAFCCKQNVQKTRWDFLSWILFTPTLIICDFDQPQHLSPATLQHRSQATLTQLYCRMRHWSMITPQHWSLSVEIISNVGECCIQIWLRETFQYSVW